MSTFTPYTVEVLQRMRIDAGHRFLDLGTGPGVSLALAAALTGPGRAFGVERDEQMAAFAQKSLDRVGVGARVVTGDALDGHAPQAPFDQIHSGIGVPCLPKTWVDQLAPGGRLLTTLATRTPSWPGHCLVTRTTGGRVEAVLEGGPLCCVPERAIIVGAQRVDCHGFENFDGSTINPSLDNIHAISATVVAECFRSH
ncbi:protein-L-isoaspartate O-methyltransferase [Streptomyces sp. NPDC059278]|uniref:protein-L-isoaspartate O-methyltransferase family protein n=1 Tax=Streptomyces sp. NPDC059278 TaxID=3346801 RepID=UPI00369F2C6C